MSQEHTICLLNDSFPPEIDGVANVVVNYARHIQGEHGRAAVATPAYPGADDAAFDFPVLRYPSLDTRKLVGYMAGVPFSPELAGQLREQGTELLHSHCPVASTILARELREVLDVPLIFTYHTKFDIDIAKAIHSRVVQAGAIRALVQNISACDEVWVVSHGAGENLRTLGYEGDYIVMENGVDVPRGQVPQAAVDSVCGGYDLPRDVPVFLYVGRLMWYKGLRIILEALAALKAGRQDFRMVFVGEGADGEEVRALAEKLGLGDKCLFTGPVRDRDVIRAWYCRADLFLFPSTFDTNGLVVREAAACCLGAVLVSGSCAAEGVTDGVNGCLIEENAASLAAKLKTLCRDRAGLRAVGEGASRDLYLSWGEAVDRAWQRYEIVIDRWRSGAYARTRKTTMDGILAARGELMDALDRIESRGEELEQRIEQKLLEGPLSRISERWWRN